MVMKKFSEIFIKKCKETSLSLEGNSNAGKKLFFEKARSPIKYIAIALLLTIFVIGLLTFYSSKSFQVIKELRDEHLNISKLKGDIVYFNESMNLTVWKAIFSRDLSWKDKHKNYSLRLEESINKMLELIPGEELRTHAIKTFYAYSKIQEKDSEIFFLLEQGNTDKAKKLLMGKTYKNQERFFAEGILHLMSKIENRSSEIINREERRNNNIKIISLIVIILSVLIWIEIVQISNIWQKALIESNEVLKSKAGELISLTESLDKKLK